MESTKTQFEELLFLCDGIVTSSTHSLRAVLLIHSMNISGGLECVGLQEDDLVETNSSSIVLPENWQKSDEGVFSFKYRTKGTTSKLFIFKIIVGESNVNVNAICLAENSDLLSTTIKLSDLSAPIQSVQDSYNKDILFKITPPTTQSTKSQPSRLTPVVPQMSSRQFTPMDLRQGQSYQDPLRDYGRSDLHPNFSNSNGLLGTGNQIGPFHPLFNGNGRTQQGARFDPFGPPGMNGIPDDIQPDFYPNNPNQPFGGSRRGPPGGPFGGGFGGGFGGSMGGSGFGGGFNNF